MSTTTESLKQVFEDVRSRLSDEGRKALEGAFNSQKSFIILPHSAPKQIGELILMSETIRLVVLSSDDWYQLNGIGENDSQLVQFLNSLQLPDTQASAMLIVHAEEQPEQVKAA